MSPTIANTDLERRVLSLPDQARSLKVYDQETYNLATGRLRGCVSLRIEIVDHHKDMKSKAYQAHQAVCAAEKKLLDPVAEAEAILKHSIAVFETEQKRIEDERRRQAEAEERARAEAEREREIEAAEAAGADAEEVAAICAEPLPLKAPTLPEPTFQRARGISTANPWKAECTSLQLLVRAIAKGEANIGLVMVNQPALNALARSTRGTLTVPGIKFFSEANVRARREL